MATFLLTWNPKKWRHWQELPAQAKATFDGELVPERWSTGNTKRIRPGDRLFLIRQGVEPRGILGSGRATSEVFQESQWDETRADRLANYVDLDFDTLLNPDDDPVLEVRGIRTGPLAAVKWSTQASGLPLGDDAARALERLWANHVRTLAFIDEDELSMLEGEKMQRWVSCRKREVALREAKLRQSLQRNEGNLRCEVPRCGFEFAVVYGRIGHGYAHVHHLKMLSKRSRPSKTPLSELIVVCANCHAMIHRGGACRPPRGLIPVGRDESR